MHAKLIIEQLRQITPPPSLRIRFEKEIIPSLGSNQYKIHRNQVSQLSLSYLSIFALVVLLVLSAAGNANADGLLYPLKRAAENVEIIITADPEKRAIIRTKHAYQRLSEIQETLNSSQPNQETINQLLDDYQETINQVRGEMQKNDSNTDEPSLQSETLNQTIDKYKEIFEVLNKQAVPSPTPTPTANETMESSQAETIEPSETSVITIPTIPPTPFEKEIINDTEISAVEINQPTDVTIAPTVMIKIDTQTTPTPISTTAAPTTIPTPTIIVIGSPQTAPTPIPSPQLPIPTTTPTDTTIPTAPEPSVVVDHQHSIEIARIDKTKTEKLEEIRNKLLAHIARINLETGSIERWDSGKRP